MTLAEQHPSTQQALPLAIGLTAAIVAAREDEPLILTLRPGADAPTALPSGEFDPLRHRTFEIGAARLRRRADRRAHRLCRAALYLRGSRTPRPRRRPRSAHRLDRLSRADAARRAGAGPRRRLSPLVRFFPWEDWREGRPELIETTILPGLESWVDEAPGEISSSGLSRRARLNLLFKSQGRGFFEENVLERYELLYEAGLVEEALRDGRRTALRRGPLAPLGLAMRHDHRRILATAMGRLRAKMKYRPVIFELMPPEFTLTELQRTVEAISGRRRTSRIFGGWSRARRSSSRPARCRSRPAGAPPRCFSSGATCCRSARRRGCASASEAEAFSPRRRGGVRAVQAGQIWRSSPAAAAARHRSDSSRRAGTLPHASTRAPHSAGAP